MTTQESAPNTAKRRRLDVVLGIVGKALITIGTLMLLFVAYQLWGTGLAEMRAQDDLKQQFTSQAPAIPTYGDAVTRIEIDSIGVDKIVVAGVDYKALEKGPGLFDGSPLPGQLGNVAIAGHRTSYGAPFSRVNELDVDDEIVLTRGGTTYTYRVVKKPFIVTPADVEVAKTLDDSIAELTLVSCHPKWTSQNRIIVKAVLDSETKPAPPTVYEPPTTPAVTAFSAGWFHDTDAIPGAVLWALLCVALAVIATVLVRRGRNKMLVYGVATIVFLPMLFIFFGYLTRLIPANV